MSLGFQIYPDIQLLFIRGHGVITQTERVKTMLAWLREPDYAACVDAVFDVSDAQSTPKVAELRELIGILRQYRSAPDSGPRRLAIVTSRPIAFAMARVFGQLMGRENNPIQVKVFLNQEAAWAWLRPGAPIVDPR
jgi:SpoIIAA-like